MEGYHETATPTVTPGRRLGPYEFIATPPIQLILDAILDRCAVGGCISPGIRQLSDWSGVSRGQITAHLRQLDTDGWIAYDGRVIMLVRHPDESAGDRSVDRSDCADTHEVIDRSIDQGEEPLESDRSIDRSLPPVNADRIPVRQRESDPGDRSIDRSDSPPDPHGIMTHEQQQQTPVVVFKQDSNRGDARGGDVGGVPDRPADRSPAAQLLSELGADDAIIADALHAVPGLTDQQVQDTWDWHAWRRERAPHLSEGVFFSAIRKGQIHAPPPDPQRPIPVEAYIQADPAFYRRGDDLRDLATPATAPPDDAACDRPELRDLVPPPRRPPTERPAPQIAPAYVPPRWQRDRQ